MRAYNLISAARRRGKHTVAVDTDWLEKKLKAGVCEVSGLPFLFSVAGSPFSPSLDRRDNTLGYTEDNTQVVCWCYNAAKGSGTHADVLRLAEALCTAEKK